MSNFALEITYHETGTKHGYWKYCNDIKEKDKIIVDHKYTEVIAIPNKEWVNEFVSNNDTVNDEGLWELGECVIWCNMGTSACGCKVTKRPINGRLIQVNNRKENLKDRFLQKRS